MSTEAVLYVATSGDDGNPGTEDRPLFTLARGRDAVRELRKSGAEGDVTVLIRGGVYRLKETVVFGLEDSAPEGAKTVYAAFPGERPVFSAGLPVEGWKRREDGIWEVDLPKGVESINALFDGEGMLPRARGKGFVPEDEGTKWTMRYPQGAVPDNLDVENAELAIVPHYPWAMNLLPVAKIDPGTRTLEVAVPGTYPLDKTTFGHFPDGSAWIENVLDVLDEPGEWCVDRTAGKVYLMPKGDEPGDIYAPVLTELVRIEGEIDYSGPDDTPVRGLIFRGLTFEHGDRWNWEREKMGWGLQHDWEMFDRPTAMVRLRGAEGCAFEGCRFAHAGGTGIRLDLHCRRNRIVGNLIEHVGGVGVLLAGYGPGMKDVDRENEVVDNHVHHAGRLLWSSPGIFIWQSGSNRVAHNRVHHTAYTAICVTGRIVWRRDGEAECARTIRWEEVDRVFPEQPERLTWHDREPFLHGRNNRVEFNEIHHAMQILGDGNCVYISGTGGGNVVGNNYLHDVDSYNMNASIRCDDDQHGTAIENNVVFRNCGEGFISKGNNRVVNNIFADIRSRTREGIENRHQRGYIVFPYGEPHGSPIQRNIFVSREAGQRIITHGPGRQGGGYLWDCEADGNLYWNTEDPQWADEFLEEMREKGVEIGSLAADPGFVDLDGGDFRLREDAAARKIGFAEIDLSRVGPRASFPDLPSANLAIRIKQTAEIHGEFKLRSGKISSVYFDKYRFEADPDLLGEITRQLAQRVPDDIEVLCGLEMGGIPIVTMLSHHTNLPAAFIRRTPKTYGTCKYAEGADLGHNRILLVEDVVSSGGAIIDAANMLRADGIHVDRALCVIDRETGGKEKLRDMGIALTCLLTMTDLMNESA